MLDRNAFTKLIPAFHPKSEEYRVFWRQEKKNIIEGTWYLGYYCPPVLYFYLNYGTIMIKAGKSSKAQAQSRPFNMDYVWELGYLWTEARGFSGFSGDKVFTCHKGVLEDIPDDELKETYCTVRDKDNNLVLDEDLVNNIFTPLGNRKAYVQARDYIRQRHKENLGYPIYGNDARNLLYFTARGSGKSYFAANIAAHEFLTDGQKKYVQGSLIKDKAEVLIGAYDAKYSSDVCTKIKLTLDNLPGAVEINGLYYPCPLSKTTSGSWGPSKNIEHYYKKKIGGTWIWTGSRSVIKHRTYRDNPFAAQGGRNTVKIADEVGVWDNLIESHYADEYTQKIGNQKFGSTLYQGTGGDITGGGTVAAQKMMFDPEAYDCLSFNDEYENKGKIGFFLPASKTKIEYKDKNGDTNLDLAIKSEEIEREKKKKAKDPGALDEYIVYNPLVPTEIFLQRHGNVFPTFELLSRLSELETNPKKGRDAEYIGYLIYDEDSQKIQWRSNKDLRPIYDYPLVKKEDKDGCVVIYDHPYENAYGIVESGRYVAGMDPYDHDQSGTDSLGSILIYDNFHKKIVAEYSGRPSTANEFFETCRRLLKYYNATCLYENEKKGFYTYLDKRNEQWMLVDQPRMLKDMVPNSTTNREKGMHMVDKFKRFGILMINNWLRASAQIPDQPELINAQRIRCIPLLKELVMYNPDGNFDRVMAMLVLMFHLEELRHYEYVEQDRAPVGLAQSAFFNKPLYSRT